MKDYSVNHKCKEEIYIPSIERAAKRYLSNNIAPGIRNGKKKMLNKYIPQNSNNMLEGSKILDVGANIGEFSLVALDNGAQKVIAIEPDPLIYYALKENLKMHLNKTEVYDIAFSNFNGRETFYLQSNTADSSLVEFDNYEKAIEVKVCKIDSFFDQEILDKIDILKMDAEGGEPEILKGAQRLLENLNYVTIDVSAERKGEKTMKDCKKILKKYNFDLRIVNEENVLIGRKDN
ncbi:FkbM family methyltransferase [Halarsenatibacter silvermanii]|nr:FkbM family methyltransferase [Halarsenatibacter silvermanii]